MRVRHPHHARRRIACQRAVEVGRGGNIDAGGVGRRGIRRNRRVGAQRKGRVWIVAQRRAAQRALPKSLFRIGWRPRASKIAEAKIKAIEKGFGAPKRGIEF